MWGDLSSMPHGVYQSAVTSGCPFSTRQVLSRSPASLICPRTDPWGASAFVKPALNVAPSEAYPLAPGGCGIPWNRLLVLASPITSLVTSLCLGFLIRCVVLASEKNCYMPFRELGRKGDINTAAIPHFLKLLWACVQKVCRLTRRGHFLPFSFALSGHGDRSLSPSDGSGLQGRHTWFS